MRHLFLVYLFLVHAFPLGFSLSLLTPDDQVSIVNQLNLHQSYIDHDASYASAVQWLSLYWPEASFTAIDAFGSSTRTGADPGNNDGLKYFYDFDHSVFPLSDWFHTVGVYQFVDIDLASLAPMYSADGKNQTRLHWRWRVDWKVNTTGVVSTGVYDDIFENRNGTWKCLDRISTVDENWSAWLFRPYAETADTRFKSSAPDRA